MIKVCCSVCQKPVWDVLTQQEIVSRIDEAVNFVCSSCILKMKRLQADDDAWNQPSTPYVKPPRS